MAIPERERSWRACCLFVWGGEELWGGGFLKSMICVDGEIWYGNGLFRGIFQMTDGETWGKVVGLEIHIIVTDILWIFIHGEISY